VATLDTVTVWNLADPAHPFRDARISEPDGVTVTGVAFSPRGSTLAIASSGEVTLWEAAGPDRWKLAKTLRTLAVARGTLAFSPDGHLLAVGLAGGMVLRWNVTNVTKPVPLPPVTGIADWPTAVAISPDDRTLAISSFTGTSLWTARPGERPVRIASLNVSTALDSATGLAFSPDGRLLAAGGADSPDTFIWNVTTPADPAEIAALPAQNPSESVTAVGFGDSGQALVTGYDDRAISIWDVDLADLAHRLCRDTGPPITRSAWSRYLPGIGYDLPC
jgi:WD40 repeat protein